MRGQEQAKTTMCCVGWMYRLIYAGRPPQQQDGYLFVVVPARPSRVGCCPTEEEIGTGDRIIRGFTSVTGERYVDCTAGSDENTYIHTG